MTTYAIHHPAAQHQRDLLTEAAQRRLVITARGFGGRRRPLRRSAGAFRAWYAAGEL